MRMRAIRSAFDRVQARISFLVVAWAAGVTLWITGAVLARAADAEVGLAFGGTTGVLTLLFGLVHRYLAKTSLRPHGVGLKERLKPLLPQVLAYAVVTLSVIGLMALVASQLRPDPLQHLLGLLGLSAGVVLFALLLFNPNEVGLHGFYRGRLVRGFAGACNTAFSGRTEECEGDDVTLKELGESLPSDGPRVHLICCAVNDLDSATAMENLNRGATSGVLSTVGFSVGNRFRRWKKYERDGGTIPTLGAAMTASGAAFNTLLGWRSVSYGPAATFLLAALNLRLGLWLRHPKPSTQKQRPWHRLSGFPYFKEMFSSVSAADSLVHLSDGGHFENLAVYELIRRRCRVIVASDCGQDGAHEFEDLGRLCRQVRVDFGVDIRIDVSPLRPGPDGRAKQHVVAGDIHYPDGNTGMLLFFKPVLVGSEPTDVLHYQTQNKSFPHESTLDQFYDEAQWEAYRRLGEHAVTTAFRAVTGDEVIEERRTATEVFGRARREWQAAREGLDDGLARFRSGTLELDELLRKPENSVLQQQVYPELASGRVQVPRLFIPEDTSVPGVPRKTGASSAAEVAESELYALRRMLLLLHELYLSENLEANYGHAAYLGLINYFRRWTTTDRMRLWWPVLKPHFAPPLVRFVEERLGAGVKHFGPPRIRIVSTPHRDGIDLLRDAVRSRSDGPPLADRMVLSYWVRLGGNSLRGRDVRMARLIGQRNWNAAGAPGEMLVWHYGTFVVADGMWGVGIGQDFLERLDTLDSEGKDGRGGAGIRHFLVKLERPREATASQKQALATEMQLYRSAGFRKVTPADGTVIASDGARQSVPAALAEESPDNHVTWMYLGLATRPSREPESSEPQAVLR
jgi:hypothetical protein